MFFQQPTQLTKGMSNALVFIIVVFVVMGVNVLASSLSFADGDSEMMQCTVYAYHAIAAILIAMLVGGTLLALLIEAGFFVRVLLLCVLSFLAIPLFVSVRIWGYAESLPYVVAACFASPAGLIVAHAIRVICSRWRCMRERRVLWQFGVVLGACVGGLGSVALPSVFSRTDEVVFSLTLISLAVFGGVFAMFVRIGWGGEDR
jgi:hypothetical protein